MIEYFIIGFLIAFFFDGITTILSYLVEWLKAIISIKITQCNCEITKISNETEQQQTRAIGFTIPDDDQGDYYEE